MTGHTIWSSDAAANPELPVLTWAHLPSESHQKVIWQRRTLSPVNDRFARPSLSAGLLGRTTIQGLPPLSCHQCYKIVRYTVIEIEAKFRFEKAKFILVIAKTH